MNEITSVAADAKLRQLIANNQSLLDEFKNAIKVVANISGRQMFIHQMTTEEKIYWIKYIEELINAKKNDGQTDD